MGAFLDYLGQLRDVGTREGEALCAVAGRGADHERARGQGARISDRLHWRRGPRRRQRVRGTLDRRRTGRAAAADAGAARGRTTRARRGGKGRAGPLSPGAARHARPGRGRVGPPALRRRHARARDAADQRRDRALGERLAQAAGGGAAPGRAAQGEPTPRATRGAARDLDRWASKQVACALYPKNVELALPQVAARPRPAPVLPETPPLLRPLQRRSRCTVDEETREQSRDPPRRVWRVVPPEGRPTAPAWVVGQLVHGALADWLFPGSAGRDYTILGRGRSARVWHHRRARGAERRAARGGDADPLSRARRSRRGWRRRRCAGTRCPYSRDRRRRASWTRA